MVSRDHGIARLALGATRNESLDSSARVLNSPVIMILCVPVFSALSRGRDQRQSGADSATVALATNRYASFASAQGFWQLHSPG